MYLFVSSCETNTRVPLRFTWFPELDNTESSSLHSKFTSFPLYANHLHSHWQGLDYDPPGRLVKRLPFIKKRKPTPSIVCSKRDTTSSNHDFLFFPDDGRGNWLPHVLFWLPSQTHRGRRCIHVSTSRGNKTTSYYSRRIQPLNPLREKRLPEWIADELICTFLFFSKRIRPDRVTSLARRLTTGVRHLHINCGVFKYAMSITRIWKQSFQDCCCLHWINVEVMQELNYTTMVRHIYNGDRDSARNEDVIHLVTC